METQINTPGFIASYANAIKDNVQQNHQFKLDEMTAGLTGTAAKKSFLVFNQQKYFTVPVERIAFFHVRFDTAVIVCNDRKQYPVNHSLDQVQQLVNSKQFFRVNRQYLVNFAAINEVEHYFARKLLINLSVVTPEKLLVPKEKVRPFLYWMENR